MFFTSHTPSADPLHSHDADCIIPRYAEDCWMPAFPLQLISAACFSQNCITCLQKLNSCSGKRAGTWTKKRYSVIILLPQPSVSSTGSGFEQFLIRPKGSAAGAYVHCRTWPRKGSFCHTVMLNLVLVHHVAVYSDDLGWDT